MRIDNNIIELVDDWQSLYGPINILGLVELKTPKTYIIKNIPNGFIRLSKSLARVPIHFNKK